MESSNYYEDSEVNIWREYITLHTEDYRTLDPVRFLANQLEKTEESVPIGYRDWEAFCEKELEYTANTLVKLAVQIDPEGPIAVLRQDLLASALLIAETFPMSLPKGSYGSRGYIVEQVFWAHFSVGDYNKCFGLQELANDWCSPIAVRDINEAISDPVGFRRYLDQIEDED